MEKTRRRIYAGVGSRETPPDVLNYFERVGARLKELGYTLRSGAARGADSAFERGGWPNAEIFVAKPSDKYRYTIITPKHPAFILASRTHPAWHACSEIGKMLHSRNCFQVLGEDLKTPVDFLLCWTPCGSETAESCNITTGGTATAIRLAHKNNIPVFNFANEGRKQNFKQYMLDLPPW